MTDEHTDSHITRFLNVDLDISSRSDLQPLVNAFEKRVLVLYAGREGSRYSAHLELAKQCKTADATIRGFCALIAALGPTQRKAWNAATARDFSIGIQAGRQPLSCDFAVEAISDVGGRIVLTVYAPEESANGSD